MRQFVGIDVGGTTIKGAAVTEDGHILVKGKRDTKPDQGTEYVLDRIAELAREMAEKAGWEWSNVSGLGVGLPAFIDFENGVVERAVNLFWHHVPVVAELKKRLGEQVQILIENDANAAALGETWIGGGKGFRDALCITLGTGVGGGIVVNGKVVHGANGMTGEIGHITIDPHGRKCNCGRIGCLETISSATGIVAEAKQRMQKGETSVLANRSELDTQVIFEAAKLGDVVAQEAIDYAIDRLGFALSNMCVTLNPQVIVVGGGVSKAGDDLLVPLREAFARYTLPRIVEGTTLRLAELGNDAGVIGAALLQLGH